LKIGGRACKPDSVRGIFLRTCRVTIIPLAPASRPGSSDLPEGSSLRTACAASKGALRAQRAGPALPSYLVLHHAGFAVPPSLLAERWALTPPFHPYLHSVPCEDILKVFLQAITGIRDAGGMFSVALSVNSSTGFSLCFALREHRSRSVCEKTILYFPAPQSSSRERHTDSSLCYRSPGVTRRVAQSSTVSRSALRPLAALTKWCPDFPPAALLLPCGKFSTASDHPAHPPHPLYQAQPITDRTSRGRSFDVACPQ
jgi:hypothetical protein